MSLSPAQAELTSGAGRRARRRLNAKAAKSVRSRFAASSCPAVHRPAIAPGAPCPDENLQKLASHRAISQRREELRLEPRREERRGWGRWRAHTNRRRRRSIAEVNFRRDRDLLRNAAVSSTSPRKRPLRFRKRCL